MKKKVRKDTFKQDIHSYVAQCENIEPRNNDQIFSKKKRACHLNQLENKCLSLKRILEVIKFSTMTK